MFLIQDIPTRGMFPVWQPELYYGEFLASFSIVNTTMPEIDPNPDRHHYDGYSGVPINSTLRRLAYARQFAGLNVLLNDQITSRTAAAWGSPFKPSLLS